MGSRMTASHRLRSTSDFDFRRQSLLSIIWTMQLLMLSSTTSASLLLWHPPLAIKVARDVDLCGADDIFETLAICNHGSFLCIVLGRLYRKFRHQGDTRNRNIHSLVWTGRIRENSHHRLFFFHRVGARIVRRILTAHNMSPTNQLLGSAAAASV